MPLHEAHYLALTGKIYGVVENYIVQFDASTGAMDNSAKICAPAYGPMRITGDATTLYVSCMNDYSRNLESGVVLATTNKQIWNVNPTTLAATNVLLLDDVIQTSFGGSTEFSYPHWGPGAMKVVSGYIYFVYVGTNGGYSLYRINLTNTADYEILPLVSSAGSGHQYPEHFDIDGVNVYLPSAEGLELLCMHIDALNPFTVFVLDSSPNTTPFFPVACVYVGSTDCVYLVSGTDTLHRYDVAGTAMTTPSLATVFAGVSPARIRLSPLDGKLYIPCQSDDIIIIWDPATDTGTYKDGFNSPVDVVFTGSKSWAVQSAVTSLMEIT